MPFAVLLHTLSEHPVTARLVSSCAVLFIGLGLHAQPPAGNLTDAQGRKQGAWSKNWPDGKVRYYGQFKDDRPTGTFRHFDEEGVLTTEQVYASDGVTSRATHYHPNGQVMARGKYIGQKKDSTWNYFDAEGHAQSIERYSGGELHGERVVYYDDGRSAESTTFEHGRQHGPWKQFFPNGMLKATAQFVNGEPEGVMLWNYPSGKKEIEGRAVNGQRDGTWTYYNEDGSVQLTMDYTLGQLLATRKMNGVFKEYYDDEQLKEEATWSKGEKTGPFTEYRNDGKWVTRDVPADPTVGSGPETERVLEGQTKAREGTYRNGRLEGEVKVYDGVGALLRTEVYANGELINRPGAGTDACWWP